MTDKDLTIRDDAGKVLERYSPNSLPAAMAQHHPIHGLFGAAFEEVGGFRRLCEWATEDDTNYHNFLKMFSRMAPPPSSDVTVREMNITVNGKLKPTPLDGEIEDAELSEETN